MLSGPEHFAPTFDEHSTDDDGVLDRVAVIHHDTIVEAVPVPGGPIETCIHDDLIVPQVPVRWAHACVAKRLRRGRRLMATGLASNCSACSSASSVLDGAACTDSPPSSCIDASSHVVQLPCHVSAVHTPTVGQRFVLNERDVKGITQMVRTFNGHQMPEG